MAQYSTGTITTTSGSNVVTGLNTLWDSNDNVSVGGYMIVGNNPTGFTIAEIGSDTEITLTANYPTTSAGLTYIIGNDYTPNRSYPLINQGDLHLADILSRLIRQLDSDVQFGLTWEGSVLDILDTAPGAPSDGDTYLVSPTPATGDDWFGYEDYIAVWDDTSGVGWEFEAPDERDYIFDEDSGVFYLYTGTTWIAINMNYAALTMSDADGDTTVTVEASPDEDNVRLTTDGMLAMLVDKNQLTTLTGNLVVGGGDIGPTGDVDLITMAANAIVIEGAAVFNDAGADRDFRVEGVGTPNALFVQGSDGKVGIGVATPYTTLSVAKETAAAGIGASEVVRIIGDTGSMALNDVAEYGFCGHTGDGYKPVATMGLIITDAASYKTGDLVFAVRTGTTHIAPTERMRITSDSKVSIGGLAAPDCALHVYDGNSSGAAATGAIICAENDGDAYISVLAKDPAADTAGIYLGHADDNDRIGVLAIASGPYSELNFRVDDVNHTVLNGDGGFWLKANPTATAAKAGYAGLYSASNGTIELYAMGNDGTGTQISPHDPVTGHWIQNSHNVFTGKRTKIDLTLLVQEIERLSGKTFIVETDIDEAEKDTWVAYEQRASETETKEKRHEWLMDNPVIEVEAKDAIEIVDVTEQVEGDEKTIWQFDSDAGEARQVIVTSVVDRPTGEKVNRLKHRHSLNETDGKFYRKTTFADAVTAVPSITVTIPKPNFIKQLEIVSK